MDLEEMISNLDELKKELIRDYEGLVYVHREIEMWRNRFLLSLPKEETTEKGAFCWHSFLYISSREMMTKSPEKHMEEIRSFKK